MKIALVAHEIHDHGGMERCMANLARWLKAQGHAVDLYTADAPCPLAEEGFLWQPIPTAARPLSLRLWLFYQRARRIIPFQRYDIVHANGGIISQQTITTIHFCQPAWHAVLARPAGRSMYQGPQGQLRLANRRLSIALATRLERQAVRTSRRVVAVSQRVADEVMQYYAPETPPAVVYNGVSPDIFCPAPDATVRQALRAQWGASAEDTVVLFAGEFGRKGLETLLCAVAQAGQNAIKLWVAGRDPQQALFEAQARQLGIYEQVRFLGFCTDMPALMQAADIFALPSFYDPFGLVITEAMACGLPVVTTRETGASELMTNGVNGALLDSPTDAAGLAAILTAWHHDPTLRQRLGQAARQTAMAHGWDVMAESIYRQYEAALAAGGRPHGR